LFVLDGEQRVEQRPRGERGLSDRSAIEEHRLRPRGAHRLRIVVAGNLEAGEQVVQLGDGIVEVRATFAQVAAERDGGGYSIHRDASTSP
jgi:hypothetical protein